MSIIQSTVSEHVRSNELADFDVSDMEARFQQPYRYGKNALILFAIKHSARRTLPYGIWTCADGREVVFNREYQPILQRVAGEVSHCDRNEFVKDIVKTAWIYGDHNSPMTYLSKHLGGGASTPTEAKECRKALLRSLHVLKEFSPKEHPSVSYSYSLVK